MIKKYFSVILICLSVSTFAFEVRIVNTNNLSADLPEATEIAITIIPYNSVGNATGYTEESLTMENLATSPSCTALITPLDGSPNISVSTDLSWTAISNAEGYILIVGTISGGNDILDSFDVGNVNTFNLPTDLPENTEIFFTIIPYNSVGNATGCSEDSFMTETIATFPTCTSLTLPLNGETDIDITTDLSWTAISNATGYFISIGTTSEAMDILNNFDNGNNTTYSPTVDFIQGSTIYVVITPYNAAGNAMGCGEESFGFGYIAPECAYMIFPLPDEIDVPVDIALIIWNETTSYLVEGYYLTIGLTPNGGEILNNVDVGNGTGYNLLENLLYDTTIYVTVVPFGPGGTATNCTYQTFKTEKEELIITPLFFTPNGDGYNDIWKVKDPRNEIKFITIFNRFGKLIKQFSSNSGWDGTYNGHELPSTDYWFLIERKLGTSITGHFSLKR